MDPLITSALIGGGVSLFNNLFGSGSASASQAKQFEYQKQLNQQQFDLQKQMFDYTSEYNNASNQVQRLKDAGLNPNLAYGNGQVAGATGQTGTISSGSVSAPTHSWNIDLSQAMALKKLGAETDYINEKKIAENLENIMRSANSKYADEAAKLSLDLVRSDILRNTNQAFMFKETARTETERRYNISAQSALYLQQAMTEGTKREEIAKHIEEMNANISYKKALAVTTAYQINLMAAEIGEKNAQAFLHLEHRTWQALRNADYEKLTDKEIEKVNSEIDKNYRKQSSGDYGFNAKVGPFAVGWKFGTQHQYDSR